jgi:hypothetical protein
MFAAMPPELQAQIRITSGYRSPEHQARLYHAALQKYGNEREARRWVAPPGKSQHNHGHAADLKYLNPAAMQWAHQNAAKFGLSFPLANENWHVELAGVRGKSPPAAAPAALPASTAVASVPIPSQKPDLMMAALAGSGGLPLPGQKPSLGEFFASMVPTPSRKPDDVEQQRKLAARQRKEALFADPYV